MTRMIPAALALAFVAMLGACNVATSDLSALAASGVQPTLTPGTLTPESLTSAGVPKATQTKIISGIAAVQKAAAKLCPYVPLAEGVANIFIASNVVNQNVQGIANVACRALSSAPAYAGLGDHRGDLVKGHALINGIDVPVYGRRIR